MFLKHKLSLEIKLLNSLNSKNKAFQKEVEILTSFLKYQTDEEIREAIKKTYEEYQMRATGLKFIYTQDSEKYSKFLDQLDEFETLRDEFKEILKTV